MLVNNYNSEFSVMSHDNPDISFEFLAMDNCSFWFEVLSRVFLLSPPSPHDFISTQKEELLSKNLINVFLNSSSFKIVLFCTFPPQESWLNYSFNQIQVCRATNMFLYFTYISKFKYMMISAAAFSIFKCCLTREILLQMNKCPGEKGWQEAS